MAPGVWYPTSEDVEEVRAFLRGPLCATPEGSACWLPQLHEVLVTHLEDGFVHLAFIGWPIAQARAVADQLLYPDALLVSRGDLVGTFAPAFEGFGWWGEPPAEVLARSRRPPIPPSLRAGRTTPAPARVHRVRSGGEQRPR